MLKAYQMNEVGTIYAAQTRIDAVEQYYADHDGMDTVDEPYPQLLTHELDIKVAEVDENGYATGNMITIQQLLDNTTEEGCIIKELY